MDPENRQKIFKELTARMKKASGRPAIPPPPPPRRQKSLGSFPNSPNVSSLHSTLFDHLHSTYYKKIALTLTGQTFSDILDTKVYKSHILLYIQLLAHSALELVG